MAAREAYIARRVIHPTGGLGYVDLVQSPPILVHRRLGHRSSRDVATRFLGKLPPVSAQDAKPDSKVVKLSDDIEPLVRLIEETSREKLPEIALDVTRYRRPLLASDHRRRRHQDRDRQALDRHDTVGLDLVAMVVDDLVVCGAEPLFLQDYVACGKVVPERVADIVKRHRRGLRAGRLRAGRRRDRGAPAS